MKQLAALSLGLVFGACLASPPPEPITAYRCGADGRTFSQLPCPNGQPVSLRRDTRSADALNAAQAETARMDAAGTQLERDRQHREAAQQPSAAGGFNGRPSPWGAAGENPAAQATTRKTRSQRARAMQRAERDSFTAVVPAQRPPQPQRR